MAEFCNQCAGDLGFPEGDFKYDRILEDGTICELPEGEGWVELCESCGLICVDNDGNRLWKIEDN